MKYTQNNKNVQNSDLPKREDDKQSLADFCAVMDNSVISMYVIDPDTFKVLYGNKSIHRYFGEDIEGKYCYKVMQRHSSPCPNCPVVRYLNEGEYAPFEMYNEILDVWILINAVPMYWNGRMLIQVTCANITKQKQMENELRILNREYSTLLQNNMAGIARFDIKTDTAAVNINDRLEKTDEQIISNFSNVLRTNKLLCPESVAEMEQMLDDIKAGKDCRGYTMRVITDDDEERWCHAEYTIIPDHAGKPERALIAVSDITERKLEYDEWSNRINTMIGKYAAFMEFNLTTDSIESKGAYGMGRAISSDLRYSQYISDKAENYIYKDDVDAYRRFFNRERLLRKFYNGKMNGSLDYRIMSNGVPKWYKADVHMISKPSDSEVKAFVLVNNIDKERQEKERLSREAERDTMTGLYNHETAKQLIGQVLGADTNERCCFLMIDLDDLRNINSRLGHPEGDRALKGIANALNEQFGNRNILGRMGGDEFVALLRDVPEMPELQKAVEAFMDKLKDVFIGPLNDKPIHVSVGGALGIAGKANFRTLYRQADIALFYTKAHGKNSFKLYEPNLENSDILYQPVSNAALMRENREDDEELRKLLTAMSHLFPLVISVNLTKNTYYMMEYMRYDIQRSVEDGNFENLIRNSASTFHPEDKQSFLNSFDREAMLKAYAEGKRSVEHVGMQLGDDGKYRVVHTIAVFVKDKDSDDICEISFTHVRGINDKADY